MKRKFKDLTQQEKGKWLDDIKEVIVFNNIRLEYPEQCEKDLKKMQKLWLKVMKKYNLI